MKRDVKWFHAVALAALFFILPTGKSFGQSGDPVKFSHIGTADGLSEGSVNCMLKDRFGFMWFGTQDGLNKFDGYSFTVYRNNPADRRSIPDNQIKCIYEDDEANLWIGTLGGGLCYYDRNRDVFVRLEDMRMQDALPLNPTILSMCGDRAGNLWVGTFKGLLRIDLKNKKIIHFGAEPGNPLGLSDQTIQAIFEDDRKVLWVGTNKGLNRLNGKTGSFTHFLHDDRYPRSISSDRVTAIVEDHRGLLWIGTDGGGLNALDSERNEFSAFRNEGSNKKSLSNNVVRSLCLAENDRLWVGTEDGLNLLDSNRRSFTSYNKRAVSETGLSDKTVLSLTQDNNGILWVGTSRGGIDKYDKNLFYFDLHRRTADPTSINADNITSFAEDGNGNIWVGTDGGGLNQWQRNTNRFVHYLPDPKDKNSIAGHTVLSLLMSRKRNYLWIGTYEKGLDRLDLKTKKWRHFRLGPGAHDVNNASIYALLEDSKGQIWMGTNGGGVNVLNPANGIIIKHRHTDDADSISNDYIRSLHEDHLGNIWIGTYSGGISVYDPATKKFTVYNRAVNNLSNQVVYALCEDSKGRIWAGTMGGGLDLFNAETKHFTCFNEESGLSNNIVNSIVEDNRGNLWVSTNRGISSFNPISKKFKNYSVYNGLQSREFIVGSGYKTNNGQVLFGGVNGFNVFNPGAVLENKIAPVCRFTGFFLFNKPVEPGDANSPLQQDINEVKEITLTHDQSDFTISYAALNYTVPANNRYMYILSGFDKTWTNAGGDLKATYTNLPPGDYQFRVKAANNDGVWNDQETTLNIHIAPPFWKTWWAYLFYAVMLFIILYIIYQDIANKERLKAQIRMERLTAEKMKELNRIKLNFFTHVSHELRTPLSLIMDPLRKIIREKVSMEETKKYSRLMFSNAQRLMKLIDQMLDLRKLEAGHVKLAARPANIVTITGNIAALFDLHAMERNIQYTVDASISELRVWIDRDKFEKIIFNLISNAFKYTQDNGSISIHISVGRPGGLAQDDAEFAVVRVKDTGVGIPHRLKEKVFELFYQVEGSSRYEHGSTGIGLALTKELIALHKGRIEVESEPGKGSDFIIYLPLGNPGQSDDEQAEIPPAESSGGYGETLEKNMYSGSAIASGTNKVSTTDEINASVGTDESAPLVLLVEDNQDLRAYLKEELSRYYTIEDAPNGIAGYEKAVRLVPDLVISDIMMPGITGLELCGKIKTDERTSHVPVILLTARQGEGSQIEGYSMGADAYIPKPFNLEVVLARIKNLLESRKKLRELYGSVMNQAFPVPEPVFQMNPIDQAFLDKAFRLVEENLSDIAFDTDMLAHKLKVSRRQLYRKLKALTNQTVHDYVTNIRLKKASALLVSGEFSISEVAYKVGYSEPANFSRSFARRFGKSPKKFIAEYRGEVSGI